MGKTFIGVRDVDIEVFKKFRAMNIEERAKVGEALTKLMKKALMEREKRKDSKIRLPRLKPFNWGPGTEKTSSEIDEILYGRR